jgi:hypothetical protein
MSAGSQTPEPEPGEDELEPGVLCPNCVCSNAPEADYCQGCGAPLGILATIDPLKSTFSEGIGFRQATSGPPKVIIVVGIWLLFLPLLLLLPIKLINGPASLTDLIVATLKFVLALAVIYCTTVNFVRKRRELLLQPPADPSER